MRLLILLALTSITHAGSFNVTLVNEANSGIVGNTRSMSAIITLPPCSFSNQAFTVIVTNSSGGPGPVQSGFTRPICRFRRGLINLISNANGISTTLNLGYRVTNLKPATGYNVVFRATNQESNPVAIFTTSPTEFSKIDAGFAGRSGAMIVITVLLVIAMVLLIVLLIVSIVVRR